MLIEVNELRLLRAGGSWLLIELLDVKVGARWLLRAERKGGRGGGPPEQGAGQGGGLTGCCGKDMAGFREGERGLWMLRPNWRGGEPCSCAADGGEGGGDPSGSDFTFSAPSIPDVAFPIIVSMENLEMSPRGRSGVCSSGSDAVFGGVGFCKAGGE